RIPDTASLYLADRIAVAARHIGVQIDDPRDPVGKTIGDTGDHHSGIGMADKDDVGEFLALEDLRDILDVEIEVDDIDSEMAPFAQPGQRRSVDDMPLRAKKCRDVAVTPAAMPGAVNEDECLRASGGR